MIFTSGAAAGCGAESGTRCRDGESTNQCATVLFLRRVRGPCQWIWICCGFAEIPLIGVDGILEDGLMDSGLWTLDSGYRILDCREGPSPPRGEGARGRAGRCFRGMVLVPAEERPSRYAAVELRNSRSVVSKSMCLSTDAHLLCSGPAGQISEQST